jgi:hypothetical protein
MPIGSMVGPLFIAALIAIHSVGSVCHHIEWGSATSSDLRSADVVEPGSYGYMIGNLESAGG